MLPAHRDTNTGIYTTSESTGEIAPDGGLTLE